MPFVITDLSGNKIDLQELANSCNTTKISNLDNHQSPIELEHSNLVELQNGSISDSNPGIKVEHCKCSDSNPRIKVEELKLKIDQQNSLIMQIQKENDELKSKYSNSQLEISKLKDEYITKIQKLKDENITRIQKLFDDHENEISNLQKKLDISKQTNRMLAQDMIRLDSNWINRQ